MFTKCSLSGTSQLSFCDTPLLFRPHLGHRATHTGHPCGFYGAGLSAEHILHSRGFLQPCTFEYHEELNLYPRRTQHINFARYSHLFPRITSADTTTQLLGSEWNQAFPSCYNHRKVEARGLEPLTLCLQSRCATNCATPPSQRKPLFSYFSKPLRLHCSDTFSEPSQ